MSHDATPAPVADAPRHPASAGGPPPGVSKLAYYVRTLPATKYLLVFVPAAFACELAHAPHAATFVCSALAILALVTMIGKAVEEVALYTTPTVGGLINGAFGNITELILSVMFIRKGSYEIVKASIVGSILGNLLLLLGLSMLLGGARYKTQKFSRMGSSTNVSMLALALIAIVLPSLIAYGSLLDPQLQSRAMVESLEHRSSIGIAVILLVVYGLSLLFSLKTHRSVLSPDIADEHEAEHPQWTKGFAIGMLLAVTVVVALMSDVFASSLEAMNAQHHIFTDSFMGVVIVAIVGNAAEGSVSIVVARKNKMELSFQIVMGASIQIALFVVPALVLLSQFLHPANAGPMNLDFNIIETVSIWASVLIASLALQDGESNWFEGVMFLAVYAIFALVFYFHP